MVDKGVVSNTMAYVRWTRSDVARVQGHYGLLAAGFLRRSLRQRARAPHAYFAAPVRGRRAVYVVSTLRSRLRGCKARPADRRLRTVVSSADRAESLGL